MTFLVTCRARSFNQATRRYPVQRLELVADATWPAIAVAHAYQRMHPSVEVIGCEAVEAQS